MMRILSLLLLLVLCAGCPLAAQTASNAAALTGPDSGSTAAEPAPAAAPLVYNIAEEMPTFPGGPAALQKFLRDKLRYPEQALLQNVSGKVHVSFVVDEQGHLLDPRVVRGPGAGLNEEALRLVRIMPWWTPGRVGGQPVRVAYTLPIVFRALE